MAIHAGQQNLHMDLLPHDVAEQIPNHLRRELIHFSATDQDVFVRRYRRRSVSTASALLCWLFLMHQVYFKNYRLGILFWVLLAFVLIISGTKLVRKTQDLGVTVDALQTPSFLLANAVAINWGILALGGLLFLWWVVDLFRIPAMVRQRNTDVAVDVFRGLKIQQEQQQALRARAESVNDSTYDNPPKPL